MSSSLVIHLDLLELVTSLEPPFEEEDEEELLFEEEDEGELFPSPEEEGEELLLVLEEDDEADDGAFIRFLFLPVVEDLPLGMTTTAPGISS
jgi:hypothetical protein